MTELIVEYVSDEVMQQFTVVDLKPRARKHHLYRIELPEGYTLVEIQQSMTIGPIMTYVGNDGYKLVTDHAWRRINAHAYKIESSIQVAGEPLARAESEHKEGGQA